MSSLEETKRLIRDAEERLARTNLHLREYGLILIGLLLGILGNIWANLIWEAFRGHEFLFFILLIFITCLVLERMIRYVTNSVERAMEENPVLSQYWKAQITHRPRQKWTPFLLGAFAGIVLFCLGLYLWPPFTQGELWNLMFHI